MFQPFCAFSFNRRPDAGARAEVEIGGSASESNRAPQRQRGATDFEDREGHRAPFASASYFRLRSDGAFKIADRGLIAESILRTADQSFTPQSAMRRGSGFDEAYVAGARALL